MTIVNPATLAAARAQKNSGTGSARKKSDFFDYSTVLLKPLQGVWQLTNIKEVEDLKYGKEQYGFKKLAFVFTHIIPGAEKAMTASVEEQRKWQAKGHGKLLSIEVHPVNSPPGTNRATGEATNPSGLYEVLRVLLNDGEPLTDEQLGRADDATIKAWVAEYNAAQESEEGRITDLAMGRVYFSAFKLADILEALKEARPKVYATPVQKPRRDGTKYNRLEKVDALVPEEAGVPDFQYYPRPADPREEGDDKSIVCSCGRQLRGYENNKGEWVSNAQAAESAVERYGEVLCGVCISQRKKGNEVMPF